MPDIGPEFSASPVQHATEWRRGRFRDYGGPFPWWILLISPFIVVFAWMMPTIGDPLPSSWMVIMFFFILGILGLATVVSYAAYLVRQIWYRGLPTGICFDDVMNTIIVQQNNRLSSVPGVGLPILKYTFTGWRLCLPEGFKARPYQDLFDRPRIMVSTASWTSQAHLRGLFDFLDAAIARAPEIKAKSNQTDD